jgi:hypothetical protein
MIGFLEYVKDRGLGDMGSITVSEPLVRIARLLASERPDELLKFYKEISKKCPRVRAELDNYYASDYGGKKELNPDVEIDVVQGIGGGGALPPEEFEN